MKSFLRVNADRGVAVLLVLVGVVILIIGWVEMSGSALAAQQLPYLLSAGLGGIAFIGVGCTTWISADLQDEWRELDAIEGRLADLTLQLAPDDSASFAEKVRA